MTYLESGLDKFIHRLSPCIEDFCEDKFKRERQLLVESALVDQQAQRYEDMATAMKKLVKSTHALNKDLSQTERELLFFAYKKLVEQRMECRQALIQMDKQIDNYTAEDFEKRVEIDVEKKKIEAEIEDICKTVLHLIKEYLLPKAKGLEAEVFYYKMKGKFLYYLYEVTSPIKHDHMKHKIKRLYGTSDNLLASYIAEAVFRQNCRARNQNYFRKFVEQLVKIYEC